MATEIKIWEIVGNKIAPLKEASLADSHRESDLETWITEKPEILGEDLLVIDRQREVPGVGRLDLLCVDAVGRLAIVELKRDLSPREAVAQALDYASWLDGVTEEQLYENAAQFLKCPLAEAFFEHFREKVPAIAPQNHRIILVAARLDSAAERIVKYLSERHGLDINAIFFKYAKLNNGQEILVRSVLVPDEVRTTRTSGRYKRTASELLTIAAEKQVTSLVEICRQMSTLWEEQGAGSYNGSFRYWGETRTSKWKMVFGINVAGGRFDPALGELDVWIPTASLAEVTGVKEETIRRKLETEHPLKEAQPTDCIVRLQNSKQADNFVRQLKNWVAAGK